MSKLQNIKAIKQMLDGTHRTQTRKSFHYGDADHTAEKNRKHEVGDIWTETDHVTGNVTTWEQKDGFRVKHSKLQEVRDYIHTFKNCPKEKCTCITPSRIDNKMKIFHGMCLDCVIDFEHTLRIEGKFEQYEREKIGENIRAFFKDADKEVEVIKRALENKLTYMNGDGSSETWDQSDRQIWLDKIENDYKQLKEELYKEYNISDEETQ